MRTKPKLKLESCEAGVAVSGLRLSEELSTVETEPFGMDWVLGLSSIDRDFLVSSRADGMGALGTGASLMVWMEGNAPWEVLGRRESFAKTVVFLMEPLELVGEKNDVSTFNLDFLRRGGSWPDSSCWSLGFVGFAGSRSNSLTGCPRDSSWSRSWGPV